LKCRINPVLKAGEVRSGRCPGIRSGGPIQPPSVWEN
jgi:hypothetical protein